MELEQEPQTTLRDQLAANLQEMAPEPSDAAAGGSVEPEVEVVDTAVIGETPTEAAARIRDEQGRFAKGAKPDGKAETPKPTGDLAPPAPVEKPKPQRPSTWKKDHWESFDKLAAENPGLAEYINQRESEYAKGVSTYKAEADRARELMGAIEPFMPELQQHGIQPSRWISDLGNAHKMLALGTPQQKIQMFQKLAQDYRVPLQALMPQPQVGADGQPLPAAPVEQFMQFVNPLHEELRQVRGEVNAWKSHQEQQKQAELQTQIQRFAEGKPHFEQVRETMAGLLQSGLAQDLDAAYAAAIRMPQHDDIFQAMQQQQREEADRKAQEARQATAARARQQTVSSRSGAPTAPKAAGNGKSGLRELLEEAVESHATGRV